MPTLYKEFLPCPPAPPLESLSDAKVTILKEREKRRPPRPAEPPPPPAESAPAAPEAPPAAPPPPVAVAAEVREAPPPRPVSRPAFSGRTRNLLILLVVAALAFAASRYYFNPSAQFSAEDVSQQIKSNAQMIRLSVVSYFQAHKKYPTAPQEILGILTERHVALSSPFTGQPLKVLPPGTPANPGDIWYESDGNHYKIRVAGQDGTPWIEEGKELVVSDSG